MDQYCDKLKDPKEHTKILRTGYAKAAQVWQQGWTSTYCLPNLVIIPLMLLLNDVTPLHIVENCNLNVIRVKSGFDPDLCGPCERGSSVGGFKFDLVHAVHIPVAFSMV